MLDLRFLTSLLAASGLLVLSAASAQAEDCTYTDLLGTFQVTTDCAGLGDHTGIGNEQKRMWLAGDWGQMNIIEVPPPYKQDAGNLDLIMSNLGRVYTERRSPGGVQTTTVGGQDARVVLEHKMRSSSRSYVFHWQGRNLILRAVAFGKKAQRMASLDQICDTIISSFASYEAPAEVEEEVERSRVRDRKTDEQKAAEAAKEGEAKTCATCGDEVCTCDHGDEGHEADHECGENCEHESKATEEAPAAE